MVGHGSSLVVHQDRREAVRLHTRRSGFVFVARRLLVLDLTDQKDTAGARRVHVELVRSVLLECFNHKTHLSPRLPVNHQFIGRCAGHQDAHSTRLPRLGGRRAVCLGTYFEYDLHAGICEESGTRLAPATLYAAAKHSLHGVAETFARVAGVELAWVRLFFLYGPYEHPQRLVSSVIRALLTGQRVRCSHGRQIRDFLHVADASDAVAQIAGGSVTGAINVASGRPVAIRNIIEHIKNRLDRHDLVDWGAVPVPADDPLRIVADVTRLTSITRWQPSRSLEQGLDDTMDWWRVAIANRA